MGILEHRKIFSSETARPNVPLHGRKLQKRAANNILRADFNTPSTMLFGKLEWLAVYSRINYHKATLMFKCINNLAPEYLCSIFNENCPYGLKSATSNDLQVPRPKIEYFKRTFLYSGTNQFFPIQH